MSEEDEKDRPLLHEVPPRENVGRETISRFHSQFKAAAYECLSLLEDDALNRVYCDYQDDYVSRLIHNGQHVYNFYQVKTKSKLNHQWSVNEIFGIRKVAKTASPDKIANSFAGRLLIHAVKFKNSCGKVFFLTNIHFDDDVEALVKAASVGNADNNHYKLLLDNFNDAFVSAEPIENKRIVGLIKKLNLQPNISYLTPYDETFPALARDTIYKFSEIDLQHGECVEIVNDLVSLVERKSFTKLVANLDETDLDEIAGVGLHDMLDILSISKGAYKLLKDGGDVKAIKSASIIQRLMVQAGAAPEMIEFISDCKVKWDIWFRDKRHSMAEFDLNFLQESIGVIASDWTSSNQPLKALQVEIDKLFDDAIAKSVSETLSKELLLGAVFSAVVRNEAS